MENKVRAILEGASNKEISDLIVDSFKEVEKGYFLKSWKTTELDAGHFVEAVRRFIEIQLFQAYTPIGKSLPTLNQAELNRYSNGSGEESYRLHIPRLLMVIYGIRNKRGVGHISSISPNHMDASFVLSSVKWILAELVRANSSHSPNETSMIVDHIVERAVEGMWEEGDITRILADGLSLKEKVFFLLFSKGSLLDERIIKIVEHKNKSYVRKILRDMHSARLIEYKEDGECILSPKGVLSAEDIVLSKITV